jgi:hypothetical protein
MSPSTMANVIAWLKTKLMRKFKITNKLEYEPSKALHNSKSLP